MRACVRVCVCVCVNKRLPLTPALAAVRVCVCVRRRLLRWCLAATTHDQGEGKKTKKYTCRQLHDRATAAALVARAERFLPGLVAAVVETVVARFPHGLPMPTPAALALRQAFTDRPPSSVDYAGDWYSARPCAEGAVRSAELVVDRVLDGRTAPVGSRT